MGFLFVHFRGGLRSRSQLRSLFCLLLGIDLRVKGEKPLLKISEGSEERSKKSKRLISKFCVRQIGLLHGLGFPSTHRPPSRNPQCCVLRRLPLAGRASDSNNKQSALLLPQVHFLDRPWRSGAQLEFLVVETTGSSVLDLD